MYGVKKGVWSKSSVTMMLSVQTLVWRCSLMYRVVVMLSFIDLASHILQGTPC